MIPWTQSAKEELDRYSDQIRRTVESSGADPSIFIRDIYRYVDETIAASHLQVVTEEDIRRILSRIGLPGSDSIGWKRDFESEISVQTNPFHSGTDPGTKAPKSPGIKSLQRSDFNRIYKRPSGLFILLFGIVLPLITLGVELGTHLCASIFFDPIPTIWHVLLVGFVPLANLLVYLAVWKGKTPYRSKLGLINGIAIGVAFFYTLPFIPILPLSVFAIIYFGIGLLPMAPFFSFISAILCRRYLGQMPLDATPRKVPGLGWGILLALVALVATDLPIVLTRIGIQMAASPSSKISLRGIRWLRAIGDKDLLLQACYRRPARISDLISFMVSMGNLPTPEEARKIYYRVTGRPFNAVPPPEPVTLGRWGVWDEFDFDRDQGGVVMGERIKGLSLVGSRLDGSLDPDAVLVYTEWILIFKNNSNRQHEARAQIALPPGGVVSRVTLWINGEEQEAAFGSRGKVQQAYEQIVRQRRDPVLVTTSGPDRILVQCFPVPPGGEMKVRIGITAPLLLETRHRGLFRLPYFLERNFSIYEEGSHSVWFESRKPMETISKTLKSEHSENGLYAIRGTISDPDLTTSQAIIHVSRSGEVAQAWTSDPVSKNEQIIHQIIQEREPKSPARVILVVDGSRGMQEFLPEIIDALSRLPEGIELGLIFASDEVRLLAGSIQKGTDEWYRTLADHLKKENFEGGQDNIPALIKGWDLATEHPDSIILWIHGPQPILLQTTEEIRQRWERRPDSPHLYEIQTGGGPNRIVEQLDGIPAIKSIPRLGSLSDDLKRLFSQWCGESKEWVLFRERITRETLGDSIPGKETSAHLARLWANDEILKRVVFKGKPEPSSPNLIGEALQLAINYQLVTPISGAVVLETPQQYQQMNLEPVKPGTVPTIPEPETWMLLLVVATVLIGVFYRWRILL
jgi:hypothetical protein